MRAVSWLVAMMFAVVAPLAAAQTTQPATQPAAHVATTQPIAAHPAVAQHVIVISIDGLRPDLALRANMPNLRAMMADGSYTFWATTVPVAITLPSHVSMLTGVSPERHGVNWNHTPQPGDVVYSKYPTLLDVAHSHGLTTAVAAAKGKFMVLNKAGVVDWVFLPLGDSTSDGKVAAAAEKIIVEHRPQVMFIHFGSVDGTGHGIGWGTPEQMKKIEEVDGYLGRIFTALDEAKIRQTTAVILSADHGGAGRGHGGGDPRSLHIPWIAVGPGIKKDLDLTAYHDKQINTVDTFATACWLMGLPISGNIEGRPILEAMKDPGELLQPK